MIGFIRETFSELYNYSLICAVISWFFSQLIKAFLCFIPEKQFNLERLFGAGGMPSSHSAMVSSLAIAISRECGVKSHFFSIAIILAAIVLYDASGVRRSSGEQAKLLNKIVNFLNLPDINKSNLKKKLKLKIFRRCSNRVGEQEENYGSMEISKTGKLLKEHIGHKPIEILAGVLLGAVIALIVPR